jgi:PAS domain S-box-containing protein
MPQQHTLAEQPDAGILRLAAEAAGLWTWEADLVADTTVFQEGFWEAYGYRYHGPVATIEFIRLMRRADQWSVARAWQAHLQGETEMYESEWRLRTATGEWRWLRARGRITRRDANGAPLWMVGVYMDITREREIRHALAESRAEIEAIFRASPDAMAIVVSDLTIRRINAAAARLFEQVTGARELEGTNLLDYPFFIESPVFIAEVRKALSGTTSTTTEHEFRAPGLGPGWWEGRFSPVVGPRGEVIGASITIRDISERKRLEQARVQALKLESLGLMASGIAHDFNNLLTAIVANVELAAMNVEHEEQHSALAEARGAATRASELVEQLLAFAGKKPATARPVDLAALTGELVRYTRKIPGAPVRIDTALDPVPPVEADATQLRQLVLNLLVNAVEATRDTGRRVVVRTSTVTDAAAAAPSPLVEARQAPRYARLEVSDEGVGMDAETRTRIFDPFFTTKESGHGLGLALALGAVRAHGGAIALESEPGCGTTFTILIPAP